jgi:hypothetical protein
MKISLILIAMYSLCLLKASGQEFNKSINKDSLVQTIIKDMPENKKEEFLKQYNSGNNQSKEFLLFMFSMPKSSKKELIKNVENNYKNINTLKNQYASLVPPDYTVSIEFNP